MGDHQQPQARLRMPPKVPIVENSITTEEPGDDILESYNYASSEIIYMSDEVTEEIKPDIIIYLDEIDEIKQDLILYDMPKAERDIIIYDIVDNEIIHEEIKEEVQELNEVLYERCCDVTEIRIIEEAVYKFIDDCDIIYWDYSPKPKEIYFDDNILNNILPYGIFDYSFKGVGAIRGMAKKVILKNLKFQFIKK